jgi:hypothetical protein
MDEVVRAVTGMLGKVAEDVTEDLRELRFLLQRVWTSRSCKDNGADSYVGKHDNVFG